MGWSSAVCRSSGWEQAEIRRPIKKRYSRAFIFVLRFQAAPRWCHRLAAAISSGCQKVADRLEMAKPGGFDELERPSLTAKITPRRSSVLSPRRAAKIKSGLSRVAGARHTAWQTTIPGLQTGRRFAARPMDRLGSFAHTRSKVAEPPVVPTLLQRGKPAAKRI